jgi:hypothetical protein
MLGDDLKNHEVLDTLLLGVLPPTLCAVGGDALILVPGRQVLLIPRIELHLDVEVAVGFRFGIHDLAANRATIVLCRTAVAIVQPRRRVHAFHC